MPKTGLNIYKRKDGRWEGRYIRERVDGKAKYGSVYARSYREVRQKLDIARRKTENKALPIIKEGTLSEVSQHWLSDVSLNLKESSIVKYEDILRCHITPEFGKMKISDITNEHLLRFVKRLRTAGDLDKSGLATSTVSEIMTTMNALRIYALSKGFTVMFSTDCVTLKAENREIRVFSISEEKRLVMYLKEHMDLTALGMSMCRYLTS